MNNKKIIDLNEQIGRVAEDGTPMTQKDFIAFVNYEVYGALPVNSKEPKLHE